MSAALALAMMAAIWLSPSQGSAQGIPFPTGEGQEDTSDQPVLIEADQVNHDRETDVVTAEGNVEIAQGPRVLRAQRVTYNRKTGVVTASGDVKLLEPTGEVLFADEVELAEDMREGVIHGIRMLMTDNSRMAAVDGERRDGNRTIMRKAVFSPCDLCVEDPTRAPLWQMKARQVVHDQETKDIIYRDATLELFGLPSFYTPYFSHPDPTVKRRSGFLAPSFRSDSDLGFAVEAPYYWAIGEDRDFTFKPIITSDTLPILAGEYRQLFSFGVINVDASIARLDREDRAAGITYTNETRWHIKSSGEIAIDEHWRARGNFNRASDDTYMDKIGVGTWTPLLTVGTPDTLRSDAKIEGFYPRSYAMVGGLTVQDLRFGVPDELTPTVLPEFQFDYRSRPSSSLGDYWTFTTDGVSLFRSEGSSTRRLSLSGGWTLPYTTGNGQMFEVGASVRADAYNVEDVPVGNTTEDDFENRFVPRLEASWKWPLMRPFNDFTFLVEPQVSASIAPSGQNPDIIPNEDSQAVELDETNLFMPDRFPGYDRIDDGRRVNYGMRMSALLPQGREVYGFIGQTWRDGADNTFNPGSGLETEYSDYVLAIGARPSTFIDVLYRAQLSDDDLRIRRNDVGFSAGPSLLRVSGNYSKVERTSTTGLTTDQEQVSAFVSSAFSRHWSMSAGHQRNLSANRSLGTQIGLTYTDECFTASLIYRRAFTQTREQGPANTVLFRVVFKHLGELQTEQGVGEAERAAPGP